MRLPGEEEQVRFELTEKEQAEEEEEGGSTRSSEGGKGWRREANSVLTFLLLSSFVYLSVCCVLGVSPVDWWNKGGGGGGGGDTVEGASVPVSLVSTSLILLAALCGGWAMDKARLPGLLGMLLVGIALRNSPLPLPLDVHPSLSSALRKTAFIVILLRGGLSLDGAALRRMGAATLRLAFLPCTAEAAVVAAAGWALLHLQPLFGLTLGFILAAVSPAVVVPAMLDFLRQGPGRTCSHVPTLVIAAASLDDVYAITAFSLLTAVLYGTGSSPMWIAVRAPLEVVGGVAVGVAVGYLLALFPHRSLANVHFLRFAMLATTSISLLFGSALLGADSVGAIGVLVAAFVAGEKWKGEGEETPLVEEQCLSLLWNYVCQPLLFALIGFQLQFGMFTLGSLLLGLAILAGGLAVRIVVANFAVYGAGLKPHERRFVAIAWTPKATVQAALAPVCLEMYRQATSGDEGALPTDYLRQSSLLLAVAVLSIVVTAPVGALLIRWSAKWLWKGKEEERGEMYKLKCTVQNYDWGKLGNDSEVCRLIVAGGHQTGFDDDKAYAELWMGVHPNGPSRIVDGETGVALAERIKEEGKLLGAHEQGTLQFLFKVLSVRKALSVQSHPTKEQAAALHAADPKNYPDANHKPEMAIALTEFELLCGFRPAEEVYANIKAAPELLSLLGEDAKEVEGLLDKEEQKRRSSLRSVFTLIWSSPQEALTKAVGDMIDRIKRVLSPSALDRLLIRLDSEYPGGDVGVFAPLVLNYFTLHPGQATFLGPNRPHAYLSGDCIECMACSDNTIRAGLTPKFKDMRTLCTNLDYTMAPPPIFQDAAGETGVRVYDPPVPEFAVQQITSSATALSDEGASSLLIVVGGSATVGNETVKRGDVVFVSASSGRLSISDASSDFNAFRAYTPK